MNAISVWLRFSGTRKDGSVVKLRIQDMPDDKFEDVVDFSMKYFVKYETFHKAAGICKNPDALLEIRGLVTEMMRDPAHHTTICCLDDSESIGDILGFSGMSLSTKEDEDDIDNFEWKTEEMKKFFEFIDVTYSMYDVMEKQNVERVYDGRGIGVHTDYRGLGIATEFFKVRRLICKEQGVPLTWAWMTSLGSQKAAERAGWQTAFEIPSIHIEQKMGVSLQDAPPCFKIMLTRV